MRTHAFAAFSLLCIVISIAVWLQPILVMAQTPNAAVDSGDAELYALVEETMSTMSVADRVGQLFLITFNGNDVGFDSDIAELVYGYRVGGVVLSPENGNFNNGTGESTPSDVARLANQLQGLAYGVLLPDDKALVELPDGWQSDKNLLLEEMTEVAPVNLPLFIAVKQLGDNLPDTDLRRGFTPLPSQMSIGATWRPDLATGVGEVVGREMSTVGVNMLLGPILDVLDKPKTGSIASLGQQMYGGNPYWVGRMGQAYIAGVHAGSGGTVATVVSHFPGAGDIDRLPDEEVSTVQRPLEELQQVALPPFRAVTGQTTPPADTESMNSTTDGLMSSLARYSAFQGSSLGRNTPIGLAPELEMALQQEGFTDWRDEGGILVSSELGAPAIRRLYTLSPTEFPYRRIALDAFTAGHDLLYLGRFSSDEQLETQRLNIKETIGFFQERYVEDPDFAKQVDERVRRILRLKLRLYSGHGAVDDTAGDDAPYTPIPLSTVLKDGARLAELQENSGDSLATMSQVSRESAGILYPDPRESSEVLSQIPQKGENILIFTDSRLQQECADCVVEAAVAPDMLASIIYRMYGPNGTDQLAGDEITSLTYSDLQELLDSEAYPTPPPQAIPTVTPSPTMPITSERTTTESNRLAPMPPLPIDSQVMAETLDKNEKTAKYIEDADWILFAMLDVDEENYPESGALNQFLRLHSDELASKTIVVFALNAPLFLDATEISKLNAYYGIYGKTQSFLEDAVRALFRTIQPDAAPPVSVAGTRFSNLSEWLAPDPAQHINLGLSTIDGALESPAGSGADEQLPVVQNDALLQMHTEAVIDRNGNPVVDGTPVEFVLTYEDDSTTQRVESAQTRDGVAGIEIVPERPGIMEVLARTGGATSGEVRRINIAGAVTTAEVEGGDANSVAPVPTAPAVESDAVAMLPESAESAPEAVTQNPALAITIPDPISLASLFIALLTIVAMTSMLVIVQVHVISRKTLVHSILWAMNFGLLAYILYAFGWLPGADRLQASLRIWGSAIVVFVGMLLPLLWLQLRNG